MHPRPFVCASANQAPRVDPLDKFRVADLFLDRRKQKTGESVPGLVHHDDQWMEYQAGVYRQIPDQHLENQVVLFVKDLIEREQIVSRTGQLKSAAGHVVNETLSAMKARVGSDPSVAMPFWHGPGACPPGDRLVLLNGTLILDSTGVLGSEPLTPQWVSRVQIPARLPSSETPCPRWLEFLDSAMDGDPERIALLQEIAGWLMVSDTSLQKFVIFDGDGGTGKSTYLRTITKLLGDDNVSHVPLEKFNDRFSLAPTVGKLANLCGDMGKVTDAVEGPLKMFTGEDRMQFEHKYQDTFYDRPTARLIFATNDRPQFTDRSDGIWRRMVLVPFDHQATDAEKRSGLEAALDVESQGIFCWALYGLQRLRENGQLTEPKAVKAAVAVFKAEANPARTFLADYYEADANGGVLVSDAYDAYRQACVADGQRLLTNVHFGREVHKVFKAIVKKRSGLPGRPWQYAGIKVRALAVDLAGGGPGVSEPCPLTGAA